MSWCVYSALAACPAPIIIIAQPLTLNHNGRRDVCIPKPSALHNLRLREEPQGEADEDCHDGEANAKANDGWYRVSRSSAFITTFHAEG